MAARNRPAPRKEGGGRRAARFLAAMTMVTAALLLLPLFLETAPWPEAPRRYLEENGVKETGAINLVSAIYLGYRAFDTLGETIVLLTAVSGTIALLSVSAHTQGRPRSPEGTARPRTHLVEVVTGKLGPIVLMFGVYVMLYGHLSPGGGFQGGVVIASGIIFLGLGTRADSYTPLTRPDILTRIEAVAFLCLILAGVSGIAAGTGLFRSPWQATPELPAGFIILLNTVIGLKVGAGIGMMGILMLQEAER